MERAYICGSGGGAQAGNKQTAARYSVRSLNGTVSYNFSHLFAISFCHLHLLVSEGMHGTLHNMWPMTVVIYYASTVLAEQNE